MTQPLTLRSALLLTVPPLMWSANAVVGRMAVGLVPPVTLNWVRWLIAFALLLPLGWAGLRDVQALRTRWVYLSMLGLLGMGSYNALQYLALHTSSPLNVTLIAASSPVWTLAIGRLFYGTQPDAARTDRRGDVAAGGGVGDRARAVGRADAGALRGGRLADDRRHHQLELLQLDAGPASCAHAGRSSARPGIGRSSCWCRRPSAWCGARWPRAWSGGWAIAHIAWSADRVGDHALCGGGAGHPGLPLLGAGGEPRGAGRGGLLREPHAALCRGAVGCAARRLAAGPTTASLSR